MDVPVREEGAADDEVILFPEVNDSYSIVCDVTYSMLSHDSFFVLVVVSYRCMNVSKQEQDIMSWNIANCHLQRVVENILVLFICVFSGGVDHDNGEFDVPCVQPYV